MSNIREFCRLVISSAQSDILTEIEGRMETAIRLLNDVSKRDLNEDEEDVIDKAGEILTCAENLEVLRNLWYDIADTQPEDMMLWLPSASKE